VLFSSFLGWTRASDGSLESDSGVGHRTRQTRLGDFLAGGGKRTKEEIGGVLGELVDHLGRD